MLPEIKCYFFYSQDCKACEQIMRDVFPALGEKYNLHIRFMDLGEPNNYELLVKLEEKYNDTGNDIPVLIIGDNVLGGKKEIKNGFEKLLQKYKKEGIEFPTVEVKPDTTDTLGTKK